MSNEGDGPLRIALLGGVPASLGGGGLERQIRETAQSLSRVGHEVFHVGGDEPARAFDVLHAFGAEPDVCHWLAHWRVNPAPLVVSPVIVLPHRRVRRELVAARVPMSSWGPRMRADVLRRADLAIAQSRHEATVLERLGVAAVETVPNGVARETVGDAPPSIAASDAPYVMLVGTVNARKRQTETVRALTGLRPVVVGGFEGSAAERADFEAAIASSGGHWLGEMHDRPALLGLVKGARCVVQFSRAEGQSLALLEAMSLGTPVVASRLPATAELAERFPRHVIMVDNLAQVAPQVRALPPRTSEPAPVPTWDEVAALLVPLYRATLQQWRARRDSRD